MAAARQVLGLGAQAKQAMDSTSSSKAIAFYREVARCLPYVLKQYNLQELTTVSELRHNLTKVFRKYENVEKSTVVDLLVYKGREELEMILMQHKQRHHLISEYVKNPALDKVEKPKTMSSFLESFLKSN
ncbi:hypothetical protein Ndes2526B_g00264 [Nannochloris sp. 'desiccata']|nr:hypothetical protein KSW81_003067 [Chlorella desiccata (nom. nud.)]KAH7624893.1 putative NADH dehydrogenase [ubiquinone] 1 alpha subcomplex subunit 6 [Chlorella desiccata (nom. nud.)]